MSRKTITVILVLILLLMGGAAIFYYYTPSAPEGPPQRQEDEGDFFPFRPSGDEEGSGFEEVSTTTQREERAPLFRQISEKPSSGGVIFSKNKEFLIRYNNKSTGHIFETKATSTNKTRITNTTIPGIHKAHWSPKGDYFLAQKTGKDDETIKTIYANLVKKEDEGKKDNESQENQWSLETKFLRDGMRSLEISPDGGEIFYLLTKNGEVNGVVSSPQDTNPTAVFSSSLLHWRAEWDNNEITLFTAPSGKASGVMFDLNPSTGEKEKMDINTNGLVAKSSTDGSYVLYSADTKEGLQTSIYNPQKGTSKTIPIQTLPEKCVWSKTNKNTLYCAVPRSLPIGTYPDSWYQGLISFNDDIWKINAEQKTAEKIFTISDNKYGKFDIIELALSPKDKYLLFKNKKGGLLWSLRIAN